MKTEDVVLIAGAGMGVYVFYKWFAHRQQQQAPGKMVRIGGYPASNINPAPWAVPLPQYTTGRPPAVDLFAFLNPSSPFKAPGRPVSIAGAAPTVGTRGEANTPDSMPDNWDSKFWSPAAVIPPGAVWNDEAEVYQIPMPSGEVVQYEV